MELLTSLPAELVALADPSARGAAPLLRPAEADADSTALPGSFDAFLALLATPLPTGEAWPLPGKELPLVPPETVPLAASDATLDADAFATSATDAAMLARLRLAATAPLADSTAASTTPQLQLPEAGAAAQLTSVTPPPVEPAVVADTGATIDLQVAATQTGAEAVALATGPDTQTSTADSSELPSWLETVTARDERPARPAAASGDARPSATQAQAGVAPPAVVASQPAAEAVAAVVRDATRNNDVPKISTAAAVTTSVESPSVSRPEWLPAGQASATSAAPSPAAGPPIDMRSQSWQDAFANRVQWLVDSNIDEARITLHPPELGAVDIDISLIDDKTFVQMTTATTAARDELSQSLPRLRELFAASGLELGGASVHDGSGGQLPGERSGAAASTPRYFAPLGDLADEAPVAARARPPGRIDIFA